MGELVKKISAKIKRRETPFYAACYDFAKGVRNFPVPYNRRFHSFLYDEWCFRCSMWHNFWRKIYYEPMFKSQCVSIGKNFRMEYAMNGSAKIRGNLRVTIGDNVTIFDNTAFIGLKVLEKPELIVGDNSYLAPFVKFIVGSRVTVGRHCMIGARIVTDNPGHPIEDVMERMTSGGGSPGKESIKPISIGDFCMLALDTVVYPGVNIGDGVVANVGTHINRDVPHFCQVEGNPMRIRRKLPIPEELEELVGTERFKIYKRTHEELQL